MFQLKFDGSFSKIVKAISYWKTTDDIPVSILEFILNHFNGAVLWDGKKQKSYCYYCLCELDDNSFCSHCGRSYEKQKYASWYDLDTENDSHWEDIERFFAFDFSQNAVLLYVLELYTSFYYSSCAKQVFQTSEVEIREAFVVEADGFRDLQSDKVCSFQEFYDDVYVSMDSDDNDLVFLNNIDGFVYTENLNELKNTVYAYSFLWEAKKYFESESVPLISLFFLPLYFSQFEYLMKFGMFNLAFHSPNIFRIGKNFEETFDIDKKYLPFIAQHDMTWSELQMFRAYPKENIDLIRYFSGFLFYNDEALDIIQTYNVDLEWVKNYLESHDMISDYT
ncbi:MAG: hypothetical protein K2M17_03170, partial [Bacilli bacterium]|nr:hypothetical protein [Bacilli bacterium]